MITKEQKVMLIKELKEMIQNKKELISEIKEEVEELEIIKAGLESERE